MVLLWKCFRTGSDCSEIAGAAQENLNFKMIQGNDILKAAKCTHEDNPELDFAVISTHFMFNFAVFMLGSQYFVPPPHRSQLFSGDPPQQCALEQLVSSRGQGCSPPAEPRETPSLRAHAHLLCPVTEEQQQAGWDTGSAMGIGWGWQVGWAWAGPPPVERHSHKGLRVVTSPPAGPTSPSSLHLLQPLLHVACEESQDGQLGTQGAGHVPQGEGLYLPLVGHVADLAVGRGTGWCQLSWPLSWAPHTRTPSQIATSS